MIFKPTLFSLAISAAICPAETIANWKVMFTAASGLASSTSGLNTHSPVFGDGSANDMDGVGVAGRFGTLATPQSVTLEVGQTLTVTASVTFTGGVTSGGSAYRFAVLEDGGKFDVPSPENWAGGWLHLVNTASSGELFRARTDGNYMSNATIALDLNATKSISGTFNADSATPYLWTMAITRASETTIDLSSSLAGGPGNYSETFIANNLTTTRFTYNAVGMQATSAGDLDRLSVSNAAFSVETIEPPPPPPPPISVGTRVLGIDFNRNDALGSPSQSLLRIVAGSAANQAANAPSYTRMIGGKQITISQPGGVNFEFRGANTDSSRSIPGGDTSRPFLVSDFIATRSGAIDLTITGLAAGNYVFRSYHLDTLTGSGLGFAQGTTTTTPNTIQAKIGGVVKASVQPTALGVNGLGTTFINNSQIPTLSFGFTHNGAGPLTIELRATQSNGSDSYLLLNGFELFQANP